jgi:hypothetical protein
MAVSSDGRALFFSTSSGIRLYPLGSSGGVAAPLLMAAATPASRVSGVSRAVRQDGFAGVGVVGGLSDAIASLGMGAGSWSALDSEGNDPGGVYLPADFSHGRDFDGSSA